MAEAQFKYAQNPQTRQRGLEAYEDRLALNVPLLKKAIELRWECAELLGYDNWADYVDEPKMIKSSKNALEVTSRTLIAVLDI